MSEEQEDLKPAWLKVLRAALDEMPRDYRARYEQVSAMRHAVLREFASAIQRQLNDYLQSLPQETVEEKRHIAKTVNSELRVLNLSVRCPVTQLPATLVAEPGYLNRTSKFRFQSFDTSGRRWQKGVSHKVPLLELIEAPPREESLAMRQRQADGQDSLPPR